MKIYTKTNNLNKKTVGLVLVGDDNQIYMMNAVQLQSNDDNLAHLMGIKRAMSFVRNMKPLHANNDIEIFNSIKEENQKLFEKQLKEDKYVQRFLKDKKISLTYNRDKNDFDKQMMMVAQHQINFSFNNQQGYER